MKRNYLLAICLLLIVLFSGFAFVWLTPSHGNRDSVILKSYASLPDAVQGILHGEVDILQVDKIDLQTLKYLRNNTQIKLVNIPSFDFTYIGLNLRNWPLNDNYLRRAMLYAYNRPRMLSQALGGLGESLQPSLFSPAYSTLGWPLPVDPYGYDPAKAKTLLNSEGFIESSAFRIDPSTGDTLKKMLIISRLSQRAEVVAADLFAKDMQTIGLPIVSLPMSDRDFDLAMRTYTFDIFIDSQLATSAPTWLYNLFATKSDIAPVPLGTNLIGYHNAKFDTYVTELMTARNQDEIHTAANKCQETFVADIPVIPVFSKDLLVATSSKLSLTTIVGSISDTIRNTAVNIMKNPSFSLPLRIGFTSEFDSLNPTASSDPGDWTALRLLTDPLLSINQQGRLEPNLATQWTVSDDGTVITVSLRQDARFSNGQSITVDDVTATLNWLVHNVKYSSPLYLSIKEVSRAYALDQKTLRIILSRPDKFAINSVANVFALPENRLRNNQSILSPLRSQLLVSSGPFVLREFTQRNGVYMQLNNLYFGKPAENLENIQAFTEETIQGTQILPGTGVKISSSPLSIDRQIISNASYQICAYDQNDFPTRCTPGKYVGQGTYSAVLQMDSRFHIGPYRIESTIYGTLPNGTFTIFEQRTIMIRAYPLYPALLFLVLTLTAAFAFAMSDIAHRPRHKTLHRRSPRKVARMRSRSHQLSRA